MEIFSLPDAFGFDVTGPHAERYLHARLTNNIRDLAVGKECLAAALTPQGRVEGFFGISRLEKNRFLLVCDGGSREEVLSALTRFVVADRVTFTPFPDDFKYLHAVESALKIDTEITLFTMQRDRTGKVGLDIFGPSLEVDAISNTLVSSGAAVLSEAERNVKRILASIPSFPEELNPKLLFAEAPIKGAVSFTKGCYVGQEVLEKIDSHGRTESVLVPYETEGEMGSVVVGASLSGTEGNIGKVISAYKKTTSNVVVGFARIKRREGVSDATLPTGVKVRFI